MTHASTTLCWVPSNVTLFYLSVRILASIVVKILITRRPTWLESDLVSWRMWGAITRHCIFHQVHFGNDVILGLRLLLLRAALTPTHRSLFRRDTLVSYRAWWLIFYALSTIDRCTTIFTIRCSFGNAWSTLLPLMICRCAMPNQILCLLKEGLSFTILTAQDD